MVSRVQVSVGVQSDLPEIGDGDSPPSVKIGPENHNAIIKTAHICFDDLDLDDDANGAYISLTCSLRYSRNIQVVPPLGD